MNKTQGLILTSGVLIAAAMLVYAPFLCTIRMDLAHPTTYNAPVVGPVGYHFISDRPFLNDMAASYVYKVTKVKYEKDEEMYVAQTYRPLSSFAIDWQRLELQWALLGIAVIGCLWTFKTRKGTTAVVVPAAPAGSESLQHPIQHH